MNCLHKWIILNSTIQQRCLVWSHQENCIAICHGEIFICSFVFFWFALMFGYYTAKATETMIFCACTLISIAFPFHCFDSVGSVSWIIVCSVCFGSHRWLPYPSSVSHDQNVVVPLVASHSINNHTIFIAKLREFSSTLHTCSAHAKTHTLRHEANAHMHWF